ncbi:lectin-like protein [Fusibacillus kribbianus]|uniref:Lectin-like protein n=1 Tax=Fusibacillus kribbianus TaxID=3044208 RepID=A0AAP4BCY3_9FIRM|nr:lectin-like protein [Ruminococcus sp. YH-rum2234]MDI9242466.1 lectin-like protein [Ruminococcus sp. YH-rum2234]
MAKYCGYCGAKMPDNAKVCGACGRAFALPRKESAGGADGKAARPAEVQEAQGATQRWSAAGAAQTKERPRGKVRHTSRIVIAVGLVILLAVGFCVFPREKTLQESSGLTSSAVLPAHFTDRQITDERSAQDAVGDVAALLGIESPAEELEAADRREVLGDTYYRFRQMYHGVPVYGRSVVVSASAEGTAQMLSSGYEPLEDISVEPKLSEEAALAAAAGQYSDQANLTSEGLVIYPRNGEKPELAWLIDCCAGETLELCFISAMDGRCLGTDSLVRTDTVLASGKDIHGTLFEGENGFFCRTTDKGKYELADEERGITVYNNNGNTLKGLDEMYGILDGEKGHFYKWEDGKWIGDDGTVVTISGEDNGSFVIRDQNGTVISEHGCWGFHFQIKYPLENNPIHTVTEVISNTPYFRNKEAVTVMTRTAAAFDFYQTVLKRNGYDDEWGPTWAFFNDNRGGDSTNSSSRQLPGIPGAIIVLGKDSTLSDDIIAHEYTHNVQLSICNLTYYGESGALMEAYADIFGELFEEWYTGSCDWVHNSDRSLMDPEGSKGKYPAEYEGKNWKDPLDRVNDRGGVHSNCTVITHAAWLMTQPSVNPSRYEPLSTNDLARLFYRSMFGIANADITFSEFRSVLTYTAYSMCQSGQLTAKQVAMVDWAMGTKAGIPSSLLRDEKGRRMVSIDGKAKLFVYRWDGRLCDNYDLRITRLNTDTLPDASAGNLQRGESRTYSVREADAFQIDLEPGIYEFTLTDPTGAVSPETEYLRVAEKDGLAGYPFYPGFGDVSDPVATVDVKPGESHFYQITYETLTWEEAKKACEDEGGHLATITSAEEQAAIEALNVQDANLWIGANLDDSGAWAWVTGEPWSYTNWNEGEPNNSSNVAPNETCAAVWPKGWNDLANDNLYEQSGYICEWDGAQEPAVTDSSRLKCGVYVSSQDPGNTLTVHQVDGNTATFTVFWPRIASIDHAEATFQGTTGDFYYLGPSGGYHAAGQLVDNLDGTLVLTLTDSDLPYVSVGTAETYVLDETQAVEEWEPAASSGGILTDEQLENLKISLGVPEDMRVQYLQSDLSYWPSGRCWEVYVQLLHEGNAIAMASVNPGSGEATRNIIAYSGAEYPASLSEPHSPDSLIGDWKLDENEHSRVQFIDFKQNREVTVWYSSGETETAPYRIESVGIVVTGQNTVHYYYIDGTDLYLSENLDRPALLYHLRE